MEYMIGGYEFNFKKGYIRKGDCYYNFVENFNYEVLYDNLISLKECYPFWFFLFPVYIDYSNNQKTGDKLGYQIAKIGRDRYIAIENFGEEILMEFDFNGICEFLVEMHLLFYFKEEEK